MLRPIAAGLMCLGFVTLGVAATWGQDGAGKSKTVDVSVVEKDASAAAQVAEGEPGQAGDLKRVEIRIGEDGAAVVNEGADKRVDVREGGEVIILEQKDGKIVQRIQANPQYAPVQARVRLAGPPVVDAGTREALEKLIVGLKDEAKRLEGEGQKEEAAKKRQSIQALEQVVNPGPRWGAIAGQPVSRDAAVFRRIAGAEEAGPAAEELKKLRARMEELHAQISKLPEADNEGRARLQQEMAELKKQAAERHQRWIAKFPGAGQLPPGFAPGQPLPPGALPPVALPGEAPGMIRFTTRGPVSEADILAHRAHALRQAAAQLKQAGLDDQAGELAKQAEKLQAEADKIRAQAPHAGGMGHFGGGPGMDLHRSIHELQEQIQQLRKEVAEVRELLQRQPLPRRPHGILPEENR